MSEYILGRQPNELLFKYDSQEKSIKLCNRNNEQLQNIDLTVVGQPGQKGQQGQKGEQGIQGEKGQQGQPGEDGYTPQRGIDYWTQSDKSQIKSQIKSYVDEKILNGEW